MTGIRGKSLLVECAELGLKFVISPKRFKSGKTGWYAQIQTIIIDDGKTTQYKGSMMLYGDA